MDIEQRLRKSLVAPDPGAVFTARVMARVGRGRRRTGIMLAGTVLAVGAAAATLVWRTTDVRLQPVEIAAVPTVSDPGRVAQERVVQAVPGAGEPVADRFHESASPAPARSGAITPRYSVLVMPLRQESQNVAGRGPVEAFHAALIEELRKVPGLALQLPGESAGGDRPDYVLTITSLATRVSPHGGIVVSSTDGGTTYAVTDGDVLITPGGVKFAAGGAAAFASYADGRAGTSVAAGTLTVMGGNALSVPGNVGNASDPASIVWAETMVEPRQTAVSRFTVSIGAEGTPGQPCNAVDRIGQSQVNTAPSGVASGSGAMAGGVNLVLNRGLIGVNVDIDYGNGIGSVAPGEREPATPDAQASQLRTPECMTPEQLAAAQVETLRLQVFPPDPAFQQQVVARMADASRGLAVMITDLQVLQAMTRDGGARLDDGTILAIVRLAATQPAQIRRNVWGILRFADVNSPALVAPLVETLRHDPDQQVRLVALAHLEAMYASNPVARGALESIGREDADPVVRMTARRALYGQAQWREEILAALLDTSLAYEARLSPLIADTPAVSPAQQELRRAALQEQQVLLPLVSLIRERGQDKAHAQATSRALGQLVKVEDPAVFDLFMQLLRDTPALKRERSGEEGMVINMSGPVSYWVMEHKDDPRVLGALADVDPQLRTIIELSRSATPVSAVPVGPSVDLDVVPFSLQQRMREVTEPAPVPAAPSRVP